MGNHPFLFILNVCDNRTPILVNQADRGTTQLPLLEGFLGGSAKAPLAREYAGLIMSRVYALVGGCYPTNHK